MRDKVLQKAVASLSKSEREALQKGLMAFVRACQGPDKGKIKALESLRAQGILSSEEFKALSSRVKGNLTLEEAKAVAWVRSQASLILKALEAIETAETASEAKAEG